MGHLRNFLGMIAAQHHVRDHRQTIAQGREIFYFRASIGHPIGQGIGVPFDGNKCTHSL